MNDSTTPAKQIDWIHQIRLRRESQHELNDTATDFMTKFLALQHIQALAATHPNLLDADTVRLIGNLLLGRRFNGQRQGYFFFRKAAETLQTVVGHASEPGLVDLAYRAMVDALRKTSGSAHRATAEALGSLPCEVLGPRLQSAAPEGARSFSWSQMVDALDLDLCGPPQVMGRSLLHPARGSDRLLVVKLSRCTDDLLLESMWMNYFNRRRLNSFACLRSPQPLKIDGINVFKLTSLPDMPATVRVPAGRHAFAYLADPQYFVYPNHSETSRTLSSDQFRDVMQQNACLLGRLTAMGIVHTAPIPLFHNRVQIDRRRDHGLYQWYRAGRLDRWLESCSFPNFAPTGIRDFEHFTSFRGSGLELYRHIGQHLISLLLVAGSYFRSKDPDLKGRDANGHPVDARHLFDASGFKDIVRHIFLSYYYGFVGSAFGEILPLDLDHLVRRMIDEMGVDRYMEEVLRVTDQKEMSEKAFYALLAHHRPGANAHPSVERGVADIVFLSGPHLGGFNQQISLPELIEAVESIAALCVSGKFRKERGGSPEGQLPAGR
jgi:hypothetical protein